MRLLILAGLIYLAYRFLKSWLAGAAASSRNREMPGRSAGEIDDVMVKDPLCEAYFPKRNGVPLRIDGEELLFCSEECRDKYIERVRHNT